MYGKLIRRWGFDVHKRVQSKRDLWSPDGRWKIGLSSIELSALLSRCAFGLPRSTSNMNRYGGNSCANFRGVEQIFPGRRTKLLAGLHAPNAAFVKRVTDSHSWTESLCGKPGRRRSAPGSELVAAEVMYTLSARRSREKVTPVNPCLTGQLR